VLPLRDIVVFPHMIVPLFVGREKSDQRARGSGEGANKPILLATQTKRARTTIRRPNDRSTRSARSASVLQLLKLPDGTVKVLVEGAAARASCRVRPQPEQLLRGRGGGCSQTTCRRRMRGRGAGPLGRRRSSRAM
jgi:ATP-dependent Lon protease